MSGFSSQWLALREPVDHAARSDEILSALAHYFINDVHLRITDIGSGTGSTVRALKPFITKSISWNLIDHDAGLMDLAKADAGMDEVTFTIADISNNLDGLFLNNPQLITTSAFLDLVSKDWLQWMINEITARKIPFYAALTYDGRAGCTPEIPMDDAVLLAFNKHQKTDKGFGQALGPDAAKTAISLFKQAGYLIISEASDWRGTRDHKAFQKMLLDGWRGAASEINPDQTGVYQQWYNERLRLIDEEDASVYVGHEDFLAVPKQ